MKRVIFALRRLINLSNRVNLSHPINGELWVRVWRAYLVEAAKVWHEFGHPAVKAWIARPYNDLSNVMDYLLAGGLQVHPENPRLSQPDKHQTWTTLRQKSLGWHQEQAQQTITAKASACWDGVIDESRHGSWVFIPLTNAHALAVEGHRQFHCVGRFHYVEKGLAGDALFFSVRHVDFVIAEREGLAPPTLASAGQAARVTRSPAAITVRVTTARPVAGAMSHARKTPPRQPQTRETPRPPRRPLLARPCLPLPTAR